MDSNNQMLQHPTHTGECGQYLIDKERKQLVKFICFKQPVIDTNGSAVRPEVRPYLVLSQHQPRCVVCLKVWSKHGTKRYLGRERPVRFGFLWWSIQRGSWQMIIYWERETVRCRYGQVRKETIIISGDLPLSSYCSYPDGRVRFRVRWYLGRRWELASQ